MFIVSPSFQMGFFAFKTILSPGPLVLEKTTLGLCPVQSEWRTLHAMVVKRNSKHKIK